MGFLVEIGEVWSKAVLDDEEKRLIGLTSNSDWNNSAPKSEFYKQLKRTEFWGILRWLSLVLPVPGSLIYIGGRAAGWW